MSDEVLELFYRRYAIVSDAELQEASRQLTGTFSGHTGHRSVDSSPVSVQND